MNHDVASMIAVYMDNGDINRMKTAKKAVAILLDDLGLATDVETSDIYIVWFCKTLQNWKALLSTDILDTGIYFEATFNGDRGELYLDFWTKAHNRKIFVVAEDEDA